MSVSPPNALLEKASSTNAAPCHVEQLARKKLESDCTYVWYFKEIEFYYARGVLTLQGSLPSYYLKQVLQTFLKDIEGVDQIDNQVDVVSSEGLSSVRPR